MIAELCLLLNTLKGEYKSLSNNIRILVNNIYVSLNTQILAFWIVERQTMCMGSFYVKYLRSKGISSWRMQMHYASSYTFNGTSLSVKQTTTEKTAAFVVTFEKDLIWKQMYFHQKYLSTCHKLSAKWNIAFGD